MFVILFGECVVCDVRAGGGVVEGVWEVKERKRERDEGGREGRRERK